MEITFTTDDSTVVETINLNDWEPGLVANKPLVKAALSTIVMDMIMQTIGYNKQEKIDNRFDTVQ